MRGCEMQRGVAFVFGLLLVGVVRASIPGETGAKESKYALDASGCAQAGCRAGSAPHRARTSRGSSGKQRGAVGSWRRPPPSQPAPGARLTADCPDDEPFGVCPAGNPCASRTACGGGEWCVRDCGCRFKCLDGNTVTIATTTDGAAPTAQGAAPAAGVLQLDNVESGDAASPGLPQLQQAGGGGGAAAAVPYGARKPLGPLTLPARLQPPNLTELAEGVRGSLAAAVQASLRSAAAAAPGKCADGRERVKCDLHSCDGSPCGEAQVCVPKCGSCSEHRCVDLVLPLKAPRLPQLPALSLPKMPKLSLPKVRGCLRVERGGRRAGGGFLKSPVLLCLRVGSPAHD